MEEEVDGEKMRIKLRYRQRKGLGVGGEPQEKRFGGLEVSCRRKIVSNSVNKFHVKDKD